MSVLQLCLEKEQALLVGRDAFLVLDLLLDVLDRVSVVDIQGLIKKVEEQMLSVYCSTMWYNTKTMSILSTEMGLIFSRITTQVVDLLGGLLH